MKSSDLEWWLDLAPTLTWRFAKTMPKWPHSYVVRDKTLDEEDFIRAVQVIRTFGEPAKFFDRVGVYLVVGDEKWWTMGEPVDECQIINKAKADQVYGVQNAPHTATSHFTLYDEFATEYDRRYDTEECHAEDRQVWNIAAALFPGFLPKTLDAGCGTGLLLDMKITEPARYAGVDPSQGMLNELIRKHPKARRLLPMTMEEALNDLVPRSFDLVTSLFGSPSYMQPETIMALPNLATHAVVLMHYEEGYLPDYHKTKPETVDPSRIAARKLLDDIGGYSKKIGHFDVTVLTLWNRKI